MRPPRAALARRPRASGLLTAAGWAIVAITLAVCGSVACAAVYFAITHRS